MGYYFYFWTAPPSGMGEQFTRAALKGWLTYARRVAPEMPDEARPELTRLAEQLLAEPWPALLSQEQHAPFDALVHKVYLCTPDDYTVGSWLPPEAVPDDMLAYPEYQAEFQEVAASLSSQLRKFLTYPMTGRPIWRDEEKFPYVKELDHYLTAYWTAEEVRQLRREWPFPTSSLQVLKDALAQAEAEGGGLSMLCT